MAPLRKTSHPPIGIGVVVDSAEVLQDPHVLPDGAAHLAVAVDDVGADHARFEREKLCHGSLRDLYHHGRAPAGFLVVASTGGGIL